MEDSFDPYREWLDIRDVERPPNHYRLLDIELFESDPKVIGHAADVLMAKVRKIRPGGRLGEWGRLLDQLNAAKVCLSNPASKAAYDGSLPSQQPARPVATDASGHPQPAPAVQSPAAPAARPGPVTAALPPAPAPPSAPGGTQPPTQTPPAKTPAGSFVPMLSEAAKWGGAVLAPLRRRSIRHLIIVGLSVLAVGLVGAFAYIFTRQTEPVAGPGPETPATAANRPTASDPVPLPPKGPKSSQVTPVAEAPPQPMVPPKTPPTPDIPPQPDSPNQSDPEEPPESPAAVEEPEPKLDAEKQAAFGKAVSDVRFSMSERDLAAARRHLEAAAENTRTLADRSQVVRLQTMLGHLDEFWEAIRQGVAKLVGGEELALKTTRIMVVEASRERLTVRAGGNDHSWPVEFMPNSVVNAVAGLSLPQDANSKVLLGTFLAVDEKGDRDRARQLWEEAAQEGMDVEQLMPELDVAAPRRVETPQEQR